MSAARLRALLRDSLAQIDETAADGDTVGDPVPAGSGFFVAPGYILTCAHVVRRPPGSPVTGAWKGRGWSGEVLCVSDPPAFADPWAADIWPGPDLAIIRLGEDTARRLAHPCVRLASRDPWENGTMFAIGRRAPFDDIPGDFPTAELRYAGRYKYLMRLVGDRFGSGMSGGPVLDLGTGEVCGVVKLADPETDAYAVPVSCLAQLPAGPVLEMLRVHDRYHGRDRAWVQAEQELAAARAQPAAGAGARLLTPASEAELLGLIAAFPGADPAELLRLYRDCTGPSLPPDGELRSLRDVAIRLCDHLHQRGTLHPVIVFAELLAARNPGSAAGLRDWSTALAERHGTRELLLSYRAGSRAEEPRTASADPMSAVIQLVPSAHAPDHYVFTLWRYRGGDDVHPVIRENDPLRLDEVVARLKAELRPVLGELYGDPVIVEFVLPAKLFDEPVHLWQVFARGFARLGLRYPVVIRDLERFTDQESRNHARRRWDLLSAADRTPLCWLDCTEQRSDEQMYTWFEGADDVVALGLPGPAARYQAALGAAVYAGVPVAVWRLSSCVDPHDGDGDAGPCAGMRFRMAVDEGFSGTPVHELPEKLRSLRARPGSEVADAALLWDNPHRGPHPRGLAVN